MKQKVTVKVNDSKEIVCNKNDNLLRVLEKNGYEIEYECQEAHCGTCRIIMNEGDVEYSFEPVAYIGKNEVLPCSAVIKSNLNLTIEW
jgi:ferredoxin|tara:strand:- start:849 stop:1112 length:264 start_codon:yes stop_codon:yes gene_type:complete